MSDQIHSEQDVYLNQVLNILWKRKKLIIFGTLGLTLAVIVILLLLPQTYVSKAAISIHQKTPDSATGTSGSMLAGLSRTVYEEYAMVFRNRGTFKKFLKLSGHTVEWDFDTMSDVGMIKPSMAYNDKNKRVANGRNIVVSLQVIGIGGTPVEAGEKTRLLGSFAHSILVNSKIGEFFERKQNNLESSIMEDRVSMNNININMKYLREKENFLENQILKIPGINKRNTMEVVNASKTTERYLSPIQQLVAVKVSIKENELSIPRLERRLTYNRLFLDFLKKISHHFDDKKTYLAKENLLTDLIAAKDEFFSGLETKEESKDNTDVIFEVSADLSQTFAKFKKQKEFVFKFSPGFVPVGSPTRVNRKTIIALLFVFALFFFALLAIIIDWWERNKNEILNKS